MSFPSEIIAASKPSRKELLIIRTLIVLGFLAVVQFVWWFFLPGHMGQPLLYWLLTFSLVFKVFRMVHEWYHYFSISVPDRPPLKRQYTVDVLTTAYPGEPHEMIINTLEAIQGITYPHTAYLCDEGNDPALKEVCQRLGVIHVTRTEKINAKAGNINNALRQATGQICVILDPDHVPVPQFLDRVLPYFEDEQIGYVQCVQAYYNQGESLVAYGAAEQTYQFYGPMMMSMGHYGTAQAIGANCAFRRSALDSIGGHAPGLSEDMHTAMLLHAKGWKSVYVPEVLTKGLVPGTLAAYYKQQVKWARGTFDLLFHVYPRLFSQFTWRQKLHYFTVPLYYLFGVISLIDLFIPAASLVTGEYPWTVNLIEFMLRYLPVFIISMLIRQYVQRWLLEEHERSFHILGGLLRVGTWWIYTLGFVYTLFGVKVPYIPTPKDDKPENNFWLCLPNIIGVVISLGAIWYASYQYGLSLGIWKEALKQGEFPDFFSYSLLMAGFAVVNAVVLGFNVLLGQEKFLSSMYSLPGRKYYFKNFLKGLGLGFWDVQRRLYRLLAQYGFVLLIPPISMALYLGFTDDSLFPQRSSQADILSSRWKAQPFLAGVYAPQKNQADELNQISLLEEQLKTSFDLISFYHSWSADSLQGLPARQISAITQQGAHPLITWEPWSNTFPEFKNHPELSRNQKVFRAITEGKFDAYLRRYAALIKAQPTHVFIRFAHETDKPIYPWSAKGGNTPEEFIAAWRYIVTFFRQAGVNNVEWVWNPWKETAVQKYYPGSAYVDWIGITCLNYGEAATDQEWHSFQALYEPYRSQILKYDDPHISHKPVMLTEFGSTTYGGNRDTWFEEALTDLPDYPEIRSVVFFTPENDANWLTTWRPNRRTQFIDWRFDSSKEAVSTIRQQLSILTVTSRQVDPVVR